LVLAVVSTKSWPQFCCISFSARAKCKSISTAGYCFSWWAGVVAREEKWRKSWDAIEWGARGKGTAVVL